MKPEWLGYLGPLLMAEQGDTVIIHLRNIASRPYSIHPHGLNYSKDNEGEESRAWCWNQCMDMDLTDVWLCVHVSVSSGALYPDGTGPELKRDDAVPSGTTVTYEWTLPEDHSPTAEDSNCLTRFYHSHVSAPKDINSGLIGPLIICKRGNKAFL